MLAPLAALALLATPTAEPRSAAPSPPAQERDPAEAVAEYRDLFQRGLEALQAGRHAEGIELFERAIEVQPESATSAYNVACGHSLLGQTDEAFAWLRKASEWGYGNTRDAIEHARQDGDLEPLRSDERWEPWIESLRERRAAFEAWCDEPAVHVPESVAEGEPAPVLVVLHADGSTKDRVVGGRWRGIADSVGAILVAPSGRHPQRGLPEHGLFWFLPSELDAYQRSPREVEAPIGAALDAVAARHAVDPERTWIAGVGQGGVLAVRAAVAEPARFRHAILVDAPVVFPMLHGLAARAGEEGLAVDLFWSRDGIFGVPPEQVERLAEETEASLARYGIESRMHLHDAGSEAERDAALAARVREISAVD